MTRTLYILTLCILFTTIGEEASAQFFRNQGYWKKYRSQITFAAGTSNFLGELGGRNQVGSDFIWDLETQVFKPALSLGYRYHISKNAAIHTQFSYAVLAGDDALTKEPFRYNRNLHFRSHILEVTSVLEYVLLDLKPGHRYELRGVEGERSRTTNVYVFLGLGGMKFNPQAKAGDTWYDLRPLGTEGQNFRDGPEPYSRFTMVVPMGFGIRYRPMGKPYYFGLSIGHRMTFTDYIDDVSTVYYDRGAIGSQVGMSEQENLLAQYFSDPARGFYLDESGAEVPLNSTGTGAQRGDATDNDAYLFGQLSFSYTLQKKPYQRVYRKANKSKKVVF